MLSVTPKPDGGAAGSPGGHHPSRWAWWLGLVLVRTAAWAWARAGPHLMDAPALGTTAVLTLPPPGLSKKSVVKKGKVTTSACQRFTDY